MGSAMVVEGSVVISVAHYDSRAPFGKRETFENDDANYGISAISIGTLVTAHVADIA
jgi:hypothetical protein